MHELSIAHSLVEHAGEAAAKAGASRVCAVHVRLGVLSGVTEEALRFGFDMAAQGTLLEGVELTIEVLPATLYCPQCKRVYALTSIQDFCCPSCGSDTARIQQGKELEIASLEIDLPSSD